MKNIVLGHKTERDELIKGEYVLRDGIHAARQSRDNNLIKVITGPRRAGKSVFAIQMFEGIDFAYLNFDDERLLGVADYDELLKAMKQVYGDIKYILFDEIQNLSRWELFANRLQRKGFNIVITGSNSRLLSRELATHLTGRYLQFMIFPFSFPEFLRVKKFNIDETISLKEKQGTLLNYLDRYIHTGGFPEILVKNIDPKSYVTTLFESILFKDIVKRYNVRYSKKLYDLALYLITNHSNEFSYTKLKNTLEFRSTHTVENYLQYLNEAFLIFTLDRFSHKLKEQMRSPKKVYAYDPGTINAVKFKTSPDMGRLIENVTAVELLRRAKDCYYHKTKDGKEVDFAVKDGLKIGELIQVCYEPEQRQTKKREISALVKAGRDFDCDSLMVITWDGEAEETFQGKRICYVPLWKWLTGTTA